MVALMIYFHLPSPPDPAAPTAKLKPLQDFHGRSQKVPDLQSTSRRVESFSSAIDWCLQFVFQSPGAPLTPATMSLSVRLYPSMS